MLGGVMGYTRWELPENEQRLRDAVAASTSIAQVLKYLGLVAAGGNYRSVKQHIARLGLDTSHHSGQSWSRGIYLVPTPVGIADIKKRIVHERGHVCEGCGLTEWRDRAITLELEHKDGDRSNNDPGNLELLCPNCHSQTPTWRRRKTA
jgi:hypothetical protein